MWGEQLPNAMCSQSGREEETTQSENTNIASKQTKQTNTLASLKTLPQPTVLVILVFFCQHTEAANELTTKLVYSSGHFTNIFFPGSGALNIAGLLRNFTALQPAYSLYRIVPLNN